MIQQNCAICEKSHFTVLYPENFDVNKIDEKTFSARRLPDRIHYRMVTCDTCNLVYSNPILEFDKLAQLYKQSFVSYDSHVKNLKKTYGYYLKELEKYDVNKGKLLEIGCGNGFFLEEAIAQGYEYVYGIEPGEKSARSARTDIQKKITIDMFRPGIYKKNTFDVICCFQTLDHIPNPNEVLKTCFAVLKKDGLLLFFQHDVGAITARILGEKSPIIDIEHTYLYDKKTIRKILEKNGFTVLTVKSSFNCHNLDYWIRLFPMPNRIKLQLIKASQLLQLNAIPIKINAGNMIAIAKK